MEKVSLPKGTRDFGPTQMAKRQFIIESIKKVFQNYGFQPLETPAMENLSTLTGKYGDEGDKLLFKILESGEYIQPVKFKLLGIDQKMFYLKLKAVSEKIQKTFFTCITDLETIDIGRVRNTFQGINLDILAANAISDDEMNELERFNRINSDKITTAIYSNLQELINRVLVEGDKEHYFKLFEESFINKTLLILLQNFLIETTSSQTVIIKNLVELKSRDTTFDISEKGLRYDLTVPFARYVVMNRHDITFPFKRYQIQPVWRADRPQKGRYREFYQCDADVVGTDSLVCETEIILMINDAFKALGIVDYAIKINHRAILSGLAEILNASNNESSLFVAIDKLDKIGEEKMKEELRLKGFADSSLSLLFEILNFTGTTQQKVEFLSQKFSTSEKGKKGLNDFNEVLSLLKKFGTTDDHIEFDISLARGLSYYTGCIFEVKINNVGIGSVSGGGRYDNLTAVFDSKEKSSGVGFSFGIDRLYDALEELRIFPKEATASSTVLVAHLDEESFTYGLKIVKHLRENEIAGEIYPDPSKIKKQMEYANKKKIPLVIVIGSEEVKTGQLTLKKMETGEQSKLSLSEIIKVAETMSKQIP